MGGLPRRGGRPTRVTQDVTHGQAATRKGRPQVPTGSALAFLEGSMSLRRYEADSLQSTDPVDGKTLLARYDIPIARRSLDRESVAGRPRGLWRWSELLPVRDQAYLCTLGEGATPLLEVPRLAARLGLPGLRVKAESLNPTGSFKARGMAVAVSRAAELGVTHLIAPSAGNAGGALAAYAAVAGLPATIVMPADAPTVNQTEVLVNGGRLILLDGLISDCGRLVRHLSAKLNAFDVATLREPYRVEGKKTLGFELAEDFGWDLPDAVVYPTGGGTGLIGMWKAFDELEALGMLGSQRPRMFAVQSEGCAPIVRAFESGAQFAEPWAGASTRAAGIRVPSALGDHLMLEILRQSGGAAVSVPETEIEDMQGVAASLGAGFLSLESAAALAALPALRERGLIERRDRIAVFDTAAGFKSVAPQRELPRPVANDPAAWDRL